MIPHFLNLIICRLSTWKIIPELFTRMFSLIMTTVRVGLPFCHCNRETTQLKPLLLTAAIIGHLGKEAPTLWCPPWCQALGFLPVSGTKISDITQETVFECFIIYSTPETEFGFSKEHLCYTRHPFQSKDALDMDSRAKAGSCICSSFITLLLVSFMPNMVMEEG